MCYSEVNELIGAVVSSHIAMPSLNASSIEAADKEEVAVGELLC